MSSGRFGNTLKFNLGDVTALMGVTLSEKSHGVTLSQRQDFNYAKPGVAMGEKTILLDEQIDFERVGPALWLVKEDGICLRSSAKAIGTSGKVYADGFDPSCNPADVERVFPEEHYCEAISIDRTFYEAVGKSNEKKLVIKVMGAELLVGIGD